MVSRATGEPRFGGGHRADTRTCAALGTEHVPAVSTPLYTDAWQRDRGSHPGHATVRHGVHAGARDAAGEGRREVHGHTCEGAGAALRTSVRAFRGVHQRSLPLSVATSEAMIQTKRVTPRLIRRRCVHHLSAHSQYT